MLLWWQHVEKGNDDGLFISSVACCQELWALIMDAGTGFNAQVFSHSAHRPPFTWWQCDCSLKSTRVMHSCVDCPGSRNSCCLACLQLHRMIA